MKPVNMIEIAKLGLATMSLITASWAVSAQSQLTPPTPLKPPTPAGTGDSNTHLSTGLAKPNAPLQMDKLSTNNLRPQNIKIGSETIALHMLPDTQVFKGASGRTISVARLKQLQALLDPSLPAEMKAVGPIVKAQPGQSLASMAALPANTRITLANGHIATAGQLNEIKGLINKMNQPRTITPVPLVLANSQARLTVGPTLTLADALKRPASEPVRVGNYTYTAEQLRLIDSKLRASKVDPRGLIERERGGGTSVTNKPNVNVIPSGPQIKIARGSSMVSMLDKPDSTVLVSANGKATTVGALKQYLREKNLTAAQFDAQQNAKVRPTK